jgi:hypothetical protein
MSPRLGQNVVATFEFSLSLIVVILQMASLACGYKRIRGRLGRGAMHRAGTQGAPSSIRFQLLTLAAPDNDDQTTMRNSS